MKINFDQQLISIDGKPFVHQDPPAKKGGQLPEPRPSTLKDVVIQVLVNRLEGEPPLDGEEKFNFYRIALLVRGGGVVDLTPEEVTLIKKRIGRGIDKADLVGMVYEILNEKKLPRVGDHEAELVDLDTGATMPFPKKS